MKKQCEILKSEINTLRDDRNKCIEENNVLKSELDEKNSELSELIEEREKSRELYFVELEELERDFKKRLRELYNQIEGCRHDSDMKEKEIRTLSKIIEEFSKKLDTEMKQSTELTFELQKIKSENGKLELENNNLKRENETLKKAVSELESSSRMIRDKVGSEMRKVLEEKEKEILKQQQLINNLTNENEKIENDMNEISEYLKLLEKDHAALEAEGTENELNFREQIHTLKSQLKEMKSNCEKLIEENEILRNEKSKTSPTFDEHDNILNSIENLMQNVPVQNQSIENHKVIENANTNDQQNWKQKYFLLQKRWENLCQDFKILQKERDNLLQLSNSKNKKNQKLISSAFTQTELENLEFPKQFKHQSSKMTQSQLKAFEKLKKKEIKRGLTMTE
ncbi:hypothetical protein ROZALSC1DRAFT_28373 [Rozella allomycis CSF55]|uniref:Uncharacterized protein n=1 Tax=Rozella allomycis (strain CSF55) TaxID=988480 RepID=A0A075ATR0_ROZAC|nr:hypothetical protein O9G_003922 [Rozella allomycis CSF55]RKP20103.1 hypothetical protein ROZALSC1DRAFT_28373 [Rozella allomycis CSF55]|eukprot:EPZ32075.1 hypothetical protein O9G_003922 [Rozella allomycis CSF55]